MRSLKPAQFKVEASRCNLCVGDLVSPDTVIGTDIETGETVITGCRGQVVAVNFSGGEHALMVIIQPTAELS
jgi:hypothetical protein